MNKLWLIIILLLTSCVRYSDQEFTFEKVFMHEPGVFSFLVQVNENTFKLKQIDGKCYLYKFIKNSQNKAIVKYNRSEVGYQSLYELSIYLKDIDINTAGWDHGKHQGQTIEVK